MGLDAGHDLLHLAANPHLAAEELLGLGHRLAGDDLPYLELHFGEIVIGDLRLGLYIDHLGCPLPAAFLRGFRPGIGPGGCRHGRRHLLVLLLHFLHVQPCEQDLRLIRDAIAALIQPEGLHLVESPQIRVQLSGNFPGGLRHIGLQQGSADADSLHQVVEHRGKPVRFGLVLCQDPGLRLIDIFVAALEDAEDLRQGVRHPQLRHFFLHFPVGCGDHGLQVSVQGLVHGALVRHHAAEIFIAHGDGAVHQVPQSIGQVGIDALRNQLPGGVAVILKGHLMQHVIAHRIHPEEVHQVVRVDHVPPGLAHLAAVHQKPGMAEYLLRQGLVQGHQEDGPVDGVEPDDVLTY